MSAIHSQMYNFTSSVWLPFRNSADGKDCTPILRNTKCIIETGCREVRHQAHQVSRGVCGCVACQYYLAWVTVYLTPSSWTSDLHVQTMNRSLWGQTHWVLFPHPLQWRGKWGSFKSQKAHKHQCSATEKIGNRSSQLITLITRF